MSNAPDEPDFHATRRDHILFVVVTLLYWLTLYIYVPILSPYVESLGVSYMLVGIVLGSYGFMQIVVRLPLGIWSDRRRVRKPFIMLGMATGALSCLCFAISDQYGWTLAARAISGISASTWVAFTVLYASYFVKSEVTRAMGTISFLTVIGQLIGMGLSGLLVDRWGWQSAFWAGVVIGVAGFIAALLIREPKEGVHRAPIEVRDLSTVMRNGLLLRVATLSILGHSVLFVTMFGFTPSFALSLHATKSDLSALVLAFMVPHAIAALATGRSFSPRFGAWNMVLVGFVLSAVCTAVIPFVPTLGWLMATQAVNGFAQGLHLPLLLGLSIQTITPDKRATAMGFYQAVYAVGMFAGPFLAGWINNASGLAGGFYFAAMCGAVAAILTFLWARAITAPGTVSDHAAKTRGNRTARL